MVPKSYSLDLRLTADHFAVRRGTAGPATFAADAEATFEILQDTSCLLLHAQVLLAICMNDTADCRTVVKPMSWPLEKYCSLASILLNMASTTAARFMHCAGNSLQRLDGLGWRNDRTVTSAVSGLDHVVNLPQGLVFTGIVVRTPAVPGEELCVCGASRVCESRDCSTVVYPIRCEQSSYLPCILCAMGLLC